MITLRLFGHETEAKHFREEGRHRHLGRCGHLYDWRNDLRTLTMRRLLEPWTPQTTNVLRPSRLRAHRSSALPLHYGAGKELSALAPGKSAAPFRPCASFGKNGPTRRTMNGEIKRPRLQIRVRVKWQRTPRVPTFTPASVVASAMPLRSFFWPARSQPFGSQLVWWWSPRSLDDSNSNRQTGAAARRSRRVRFPPPPQRIHGRPAP
jgi:hypothetical protein